MEQENRFCVVCVCAYVCGGVRMLFLLCRCGLDLEHDVVLEVGDEMHHFILQQVAVVQHRWHACVCVAWLVAKAKGAASAGSVKGACVWRCRQSHQALSWQYGRQ